MTATNHGLFGAALAITLQKYPVVAVAIAPFSHFLLDMLPHYGDARLKPKSLKFLLILLSDMTLAVASTLVVAFVWSDVALLVIACAFLAASPDLMWLYYEFLHPTPKEKWGKIAAFHSKIQWSQTPKGWYVEALWFVLFFSSLVYLGLQ